MKHKDKIAQMTLKEKIRLCSGEDYWRTKPLKRLGVPSFTMSDGPHGLRKQQKGHDNLGVMRSEQATCFPPACLAACSFDPELVSEMARAIGREASFKDVHMVLGPGINIKRDPLCGRNFEYFSEDPYLSGEMGKAWIRGIQKTGVGACLKHFACNNQEDLRMSSDSMVDDRALHEIYLAPFKNALGANPAGVMCSYNRLNGVYMSDNKAMINGWLRQKCGYKGLVVTDWGAMNDRVAAFRAGVDLEMPGSGGFFDGEVKKAVHKGQINESEIDACADRVADTALKLNSGKQNLMYDIGEHHMLAKTIAERSAVLLKNENNILPLKPELKIAVVGSLARHLRFQGAGSSHINTHKLSSLLSGMEANHAQHTYYKGYTLNNSTSESLLSQAEEGCRNADAVVVAAGLTEGFEAEGFDRRNMLMPGVQNKLIERIAAVNPNIIVVLFGGAPVEMHWIGHAKAVLHMYLPGQAGGLAAANLLFGKANPGGKLAETYPVRYSDSAAADYYDRTYRQAQYRESVFVGYRYYDKVEKQVLFPFGFGLSYTTFEVSSLRIRAGEAGGTVTVTVSVQNTGETAGAEVVQVYVSKPLPGPVRELAGFKKVYLQPGEQKEAVIFLNSDAFTAWDPARREIAPLGGAYKIYAGTSSRDLPLSDTLVVRGAPYKKGAVDMDVYIRGELTQDAFALLLGIAIKPEACEKKGCFTPLNTLAEMKNSWISALLVRAAKYGLRRINRMSGDHPLFNMMMDILVNMPVSRFPLMSSNLMPKWAVPLIVNIANGRFFLVGERKSGALQKFET
jgi:beta-glucosidase